MSPQHSVVRKADRMHYSHVLIHTESGQGFRREGSVLLYEDLDPVDPGPDQAAPVVPGQVSPTAPISGLLTVLTNTV